MTTLTPESAGPAPLTGAEVAAIEARVKALELRTGSQVVAAVVERSDLYHGLRWRAFASAASLAGLAAVLIDGARTNWPAGHAVLPAVVLVLAAGAAAALLATFFPGFARLFLESPRADAEVRRRAESLFLERELFGTHRRDAVLLLVSRFERRAAIHADRGLREHVAAEAWAAVTGRMNAQLAAGRLADALLAGLDSAEPLLAALPGERGGAPADELPDRPIAAEDPR